MRGTKPGTKSEFRIGAVFPQNEMECDASVIRDLAQTVEELGFSHLIAADHRASGMVGFPVS